MFFSLSWQREFSVGEGQLDLPLSPTHPHTPLASVCCTFSMLPPDKLFGKNRLSLLSALTLMTKLQKLAAWLNLDNVIH